jgi:dolichyl-diphosphooligosaccharide---protein glycosyltransferase subunit 3/6
MRWFSWTVLSLGAITAAITAYPYLLPLIQSRKLWAGLSLFAILVFTSGHMFNQIRKVPYVAGNGKGGVSYFAAGFQNQFGMETQVVAGVCEYYRSWPRSIPPG